MIKKILNLRFNVNDLSIIGYAYIGLMIRWLNMGGIDTHVWGRVMLALFVIHVLSIMAYEFRGYYIGTKESKTKL